MSARRSEEPSITPFHQTQEPLQSSSSTVQREVLSLDKLRASPDPASTSKSIDLESAPLFNPNETRPANSENNAFSARNALKRYCISACGRFATLIAVLLPLYGLLSLLQYRISIPEVYDYSDVTFDWPSVDPRYLKPTDPNFGPYNILLDAHSHTTFSDGRMSPEQLVSWAKVNGFNAIVVSDHNTIEGGLETQKWASKNAPEMIVIPAIEYTCCRIHMNLIGITENIEITGPEPTDEELQEVINKVHSLGGIVSVNHIPWSNVTMLGYQVARIQNHPTREQLVSWGVDAIEIINGDTFDYISWDFVRSRNMTALSGTDAHYPQVAAFAWTAINAKEKTVGSVMEELKARRTTLLFEPSGTRRRAQVHSNSAYEAIEPLTALAEFTTLFYEYTSGMYSFQGTMCHTGSVRFKGIFVLFAILYILLGFAIYEIARYACIVIGRFGRKKIRQYRR